MAKKLLIVRHGKAESADSGVQDVSRLLTRRGARNAIEVAEKLLQKDLVPALLVSSHAKRAHKTAQLYADTWNIPIDSIILQPLIYEASVRQLCSVIEDFDNDYDFIAIFGHNPGFTSLINTLADTNIYDLPTGGAALIDFDITDWTMVPVGGKLELLIEP